MVIEVITPNSLADALAKFKTRQDKYNKENFATKTVLSEIEVASDDEVEEMLNEVLGGNKNGV